MRVVIETECECGQDPHDTTPFSGCSGGSRRVLQPGEYVLVETVDGDESWRIIDHAGLLAEFLDALAQDPS